jgi:hypothetical protein
MITPFSAGGNTLGSFQKKGWLRINSGEKPEGRMAVSLHPGFAGFFCSNTFYDV